MKKPDLTKLRKKSVWSIGIGVVFIGLFVLWLATALLSGSIALGVLSFVLGSLILAAGLALAVLARRCPFCGRPLGRRVVGRYCPHCGEQIGIWHDT